MMMQREAQGEWTNLGSSESTRLLRSMARWLPIPTTPVLLCSAGGGEAVLQPPVEQHPGRDERHQEHRGLLLQVRVSPLPLLIPSLLDAQTNK